MRLLLDNNLSHKLCLPLQQYFEEINHIRNLLTPEVNDIAIWNYARDNNFHILTKDNDFEGWSLLKGCPPGLFICYVAIKQRFIF